MMYKIVACDLDGTLLRDDKTISEETIAILKTLTDQGVVFLPSTGRTHRELPQVIRDLPFLRYALCCNGAAIYDYEKNTYIYEDAIPHDLALKVLEFVKTIPVYETVVVNGERIAKGNENDELIDYIKEKAVKGILFNLEGAHDVKAAFAARKQDAQKIMLYLKEGGNREEVMGKLSEQFPELTISSSGPIYIEVNIKGVDKGKTLERFCELLGVSSAASVAFGDAENDIGMLKAAGKAVVMANGTDQAKQYADLICPSNNEDGVRKTLEAFLKEDQGS